MVIATAGGREALLRRTLTSLAACDRPETYAGLTVVENGPAAGVDAVVREFATRLRATYLHCAPLGKSLALNFALTRLHDELLVFLDDDVRVGKVFLGAYADAALEARQPTFYGGPVGVDYEAIPPEWIRRSLPSSARGWEGSPGQDVVRPVFLGANWAANAQDLRALGGFDNRLGPGGASGARGQETAMQRTLLSHGYVGRYVQGARVWHFVPAERCSPEWLLRRAYELGKTDALSWDRWVWGGLPGPLLPLIARQFLRELAAGVSMYPPWRFLARRWRSHLRGAIDGWRERSRVRPRA